MTAQIAPIQGADGNAGTTIYLARQPIFNAQLEVEAYEILYRSSETNVATITDGNQATLDLMTNAFVEVGLDMITANKRAFINLTRDFLIGKLPLPLLPQNVVLEILEDISADEACIAGARHLVNQGFRLALDDFVLQDANADLIPFATFIKIDIRMFTPQALRTEVEKLRGQKAVLLAEKVETHEEFEYCRSLGFTLFQGYFFSRPMMLSARQVAPNHMNLLQILAKLQSPDCDLKEIEDIISYDVGISYKLLRIINSPYYGLARKVESLQHALVILGMKTLKSWITVISLSTIKGKPDELITLTLLRARMCENLAAASGCKADAAFMVGLFSLLDVLLDQPRKRLLESLPLAEDISTALLDQRGPLGRMLAFVIAYEQGEAMGCPDLGVGDREAVNAYMQALQWTGEITRQLS